MKLSELSLNELSALAKLIESYIGSEAIQAKRMEYRAQLSKVRLRMIDIETAIDYDN